MDNIKFSNYIDQTRFIPKFKLKQYARLESTLRHNAREKTKTGYCEICKKPVTSYCNSHSLPRFVLKNVANNGEVLCGYAFFANKPEIKDSGLNNTFIFKNICKECDNLIFKEYEDPNAYIEKITNNKILNEIALKNYLRYLFKRRGDRLYFLELDSCLKNRFGPDIEPIEYAYTRNKDLQLCDLDINDALKNVSYLYKHLDDRNFYLIDDIDLDYRTEMAYQGFIAPTLGFDGEVINRIFNYDPQYDCQVIHIAIFPLKNKTKILVFTKDGNNRIKLFYKKYRKLSLEQKLYALNYLILFTQEDWCISSNFDILKMNKETLEIINDLDRAEASGTLSELLDDSSHERTLMANLTPKYKIQTSGNIYNFLAKH